MTQPTPPTSTPPRIRLTGVEKRFGRKEVLCGIDLDVANGESMVIIGPSGCGKSVTVKCVLGLLAHDRGQIDIDGERLDRAGITALRNRSGMLFQGGALFDSLPVWRNVAFRLLRNRMSAAEARDTAIECLRRVGLGPDTADLAPAELSGGMQKRVGIARAIAANPEILFFDEPTAGLDPILANVVSELIREIVTASNATAITITHDLNSSRIIGDQVAMLHAGRIRWHGPVRDLEHSGDQHVEQFICGSAEGPIETLR